MLTKQHMLNLVKVYGLCNLSVTSECVFFAKSVSRRKATYCIKVSCHEAASITLEGNLENLLVLYNYILEQFQVIAFIRATFWLISYCKVHVINQLLYMQSVPTWYHVQFQLFWKQLLTLLIYEVFLSTNSTSIVMFTNWFCWEYTVESC